MTFQDQNNPGNIPPRQSGRIWAGLFLLFIGAVILAKQLAFPFFPYWIFSWPMILIVIGLFLGIRHDFRGPAWLILLVLGGIFMIDYLSPEMDFHRFIAPAIIISIGLILILRPKNRDFGGSWRSRRRMTQPAGSSTEPGVEGVAGSPDDYIDSVSIFGGVKKMILSKNFKGGQAVSILGGTELDLTRADIQGPVYLELTQIMGGAKVIVPSSWTIRNEINAVFGGVDDKRQVAGVQTDPNKVLVLRGASLFGGLEIKNY